MSTSPQVTPSRRPRFALPPHLPLEDERALDEARAWLREAWPDAADDVPPDAVRPEVWASWCRSLRARVDPDQDRAPLVRGPAEVESTVRGGRWGPLVDRLRADLVADAAADGMAIALTDATGVVVWTGGSWSLAHRAAGIGLEAGGSWSEAAVGTNAWGTSLATGECTQVLRGEHHLAVAGHFAASAAPVRSRGGAVVGSVGVLGGDHVATPATLALVRFVAAALGETVTATDAAGTPPDPSTGATHLRMLGHDRAVVAGPDGQVELTPKHSDLLLGLVVAAEQGRGRTAEELALDCWETETPATTVRAEMHRLRRVLPGLLLGSHPYRLPHRLHVDALDVLALLRKGAHRRALDLYRGPLLPRSTAPVTVALRRRVDEHLQQAVLAHAQVDVVLDYAERAAPDDVVPWRALLDRLPTGSARHTTAALRLAEIEQRLLGF